MRTKRGCLVKACYSNGVSRHLLCLVMTQRQTGVITKSRKLSVLLWKFLVWEAGGRLSRMGEGGHLLWLNLEHYLTFFNRSCVKSRAKKQESWQSSTKSWPFWAVAKEVGGQFCCYTWSRTPQTLWDMPHKALAVSWHRGQLKSEFVENFS